MVAHAATETKRTLEHIKLTPDRLKLKSLKEAIQRRLQNLQKSQKSVPQDLDDEPLMR